MPRFHFRLETLRRLAAAKESVEKQALARQERSLREAEERVTEEIEGCRRAAERFETVRSQGDVRPDEIIRAIDEMDDADHVTVAAEADRDRHQEEADVARDRMAERALERKAFDRLRERQQERYRHEEAAREQRDLDEGEMRRRGNER